MSTLAFLSAVAVVALTMLVVNVRFGRSDRRTLASHHETLEVLANIVAQQAAAARPPEVPAPAPGEVVSIVGPMDTERAATEVWRGEPDATAWRAVPRAAQPSPDAAALAQLRTAALHPAPQPDTYLGSPPAPATPAPAPLPVVRISLDDLPPPDPVHTNGARSHAPPGSGARQQGSDLGHGSPQRWRAAALVAVALAVVAGTALVASTGLTTSIRPTVTPAAPGPDSPAAGGEELAAAPPPFELISPASQTEGVVAFAVDVPSRLQLGSVEPTWVRVRSVSGQVLAETTLVPGATEDLEVNEPVELRTGNQGGLVAAINGVLLDHPRQTGQPLTLVLGT